MTPARPALRRSGVIPSGRPYLVRPSRDDDASGLAGLIESVAGEGELIAAVPGEPDTIDSAKAWLRLGVAVTLSTIGGVGMWSVVVTLPAIQADFGVGRADASLPFTLVMIGFACGGVAMGRLADRFGIAVPLALGTVSLSLGYLAVGQASTLTQVALAHGLLIGIGC